MSEQPTPKELREAVSIARREVSMFTLPNANGDTITLEICNGHPCLCLTVNSPGIGVFVVWLTPEQAQEWANCFNGIALAAHK